MENKKLTRRGFVKTSSTAGICALCLGPGSVAQDSVAQDSVAQDSVAADEQHKAKFANDYLKWWLKNLMLNFETHEPEADAVEIIEGCGRACANRWSGAALGKLKQQLAGPEAEDVGPEAEDAGPEADLKAVVKLLNELHIGGGNMTVDGDAVCAVYEKCYCPIREAGLIVAPYFCNCTRGFTKEIFETLFEKPFDVELVTSIGRGDDECRLIARPRKAKEKK